LTGNEHPRKYWNDLKKKLMDEGYFEVSEKIGQLKMVAADGKRYLTDCANTETLFRIIQSIPSHKAEPFKRWLARVGYERVQEGLSKCMRLRDVYQSSF
jgi:DNA-damage-inducible protein D